MHITILWKRYTYIIFRWLFKWKCHRIYCKFLCCLYETSKSFSTATLVRKKSIASPETMQSIINTTVDIVATLLNLTTPHFVFIKLINLSIKGFTTFIRYKPRIKAY